MTMDQYKEQYKKEMEQIHAPAELIARTKAAMRVEEARIRREFAVHNVRKWAYPLTAAAALLILVSVSAMMRGLKGAEVSMKEAPSNEMAMEMEPSEMSGGEGLDGGMAAAGAAMDMTESVETIEESFADEMVSAEADTAAAPADEVEDMSEPAAAEENAASDTAGFSESAEDAFTEKEELKEAKGDAGQRLLGDTEKSLAGTENITIEKVENAPAFCGRPGTETHVFEGQIFQVTEEENGWAAYVETKNGGRYVIRGEAEDVETFVEMGYRKLTEMD